MRDIEKRERTRAVQRSGEIAEANGYQVVSAVVLPDEKQMLSDEMRRIADGNLADLILTTGGDGFSPRTVCLRRRRRVVQRLVPGIPEAMRAYSARFTKRAMLSGAAAGIREATLIVNLPGAKAVRSVWNILSVNWDTDLIS